MRIRGFILALGVVALATGAVWAEGTGGARGGGALPAVPGRAAPDVGGRVAPAAGDLAGERRERNRFLDRRQPSTAGSPPAPATPSAPVPREAPRGRVDRSLVHLHHGSVRMVADLARVDLTLEVQNVEAGPIEWRRTYAIDPAAELIGAVLRRQNEDAISARTLSAPDAQRIYAQVRTPPPTRTPRGNRDPLLLQRPARDRLEVVIWPVEAQETIRVELTFVTPLRGRGAQRTYVDVMGGPAPKDAPRTLHEPGAEGQRPSPFVLANADWLVDPGSMVLSSAPAAGMTLRGEAGGVLRFAGVAATEPETPRPSVDFLTARRDRDALLVGGASYLGRIAVWRFDPHEFLSSRGYQAGTGLSLHLVPERGVCKRLAPDRFAATDEARPVTALLVERGASDVRYRVQVVDRTGFVVETVEEALALRREALDPALEAAVSGWHRCALVRRTFRWAGAVASRREEALRYAVDLGVLVEGSAALAVPQSERRRMTVRNRRLYDTDGVPLGAPRHEADLKGPPRGAFDAR